MQKHSFNLKASFLLFLISLAVYSYTLCPVVAWGGGDSPKFAVWVHDIFLRPDALYHALYILLGRLFSYLPINLSLAVKLNVFTMLFACLSVFMLHLVLYKITRSALASFGACLGLIFSHTFWLNAVITDVYTVHSFFLLLIILLFLYWLEQAKVSFLYFMSFFIGLAFSNHVLIQILIIPLSLFMFLFRKERNLKISHIIFSILFLCFGASLVIYLWLKEGTGNIFGGPKDIFAVLNTRFWGFAFNKLANYLIYLFYQFPFVGFLIGFWAMFKYRNYNKRLWLFLIIATFSYIAMPLFYNVLDYYKFGLTSYILFAIWIGIGLSYIKTKKQLVLIIVFITFLPVLLYFSTAFLSERYNLNLVSARARSLPFRNNNWYFLWPPKNSDYSAYRYGDSALKIARKNAVIIGDFTPLQVLKYFKIVEGRRPDVLLITATYKIDQQLEAIEKYIDLRPVYAAALESNPLIPHNFYLRKEDLIDGYDIIEEYPLYRIIRKKRN